MTTTRPGSGNGIHWPALNLGHTQPATPNPTPSELQLAPRLGDEPPTPAETLHLAEDLPLTVGFDEPEGFGWLARTIGRILR